MIPQNNDHYEMRLFKKTTMRFIYRCVPRSLLRERKMSAQDPMIQESIIFPPDVCFARLWPKRSATGAARWQEQEIPGECKSAVSGDAHQPSIFLFSPVKVKELGLENPASEAARHNKVLDPGHCNVPV